MWNFLFNPNTVIAMNATTGENENLMMEKKSIMLNYNRFLIIFWLSTFYYEKFVLRMFRFNVRLHGTLPSLYPSKSSSNINIVSMVTDTLTGKMNLNILSIKVTSHHHWHNVKLLTDKVTMTLRVNRPLIPLDQTRYQNIRNIVRVYYTKN